MKKIAMITAYDYPSSRICSDAGVDIILVGDSAANVVHGMKSTTEIGMNEMLVHVKAVARAKPKSIVVADMPANSYSSKALALKNAKKFLKAGANAVKLEGKKTSVVRALAKKGIKVMGHIGYLPQSDAKPVVKRDEEKLLEEAIALEKAGCKWIVLELVPALIAKKISKKISIPTIGIGSGPHCSGQVLVFHDLVGLNADDSFKPRFVKRYANLKKEAVTAIQKYCEDVRKGEFPREENSY